MFGEFYNLPDNPFGVTPDPRFLFPGPAHREALASLICGIRSGRGFMTLIARPGMGKTMTLFCLLEQLRDTARTALVFQTQTNPAELLRHILLDLGIDNVPEDRVSMHQQLNDVLVQEAESGRQVVVIVDEAQNLDEATLESVRLLSNFENPSSKLIQIILAGQPPLADKLAQPGLLQLRQRVAIMASLEPLSAAETVEYIQHRLRVGGYRGPDLFEPDALRLIVALSRGIPRNINTLCFNALSIGCALRLSRINADVVCEVMADLEVAPSGPKPVASSAASPLAATQTVWRSATDTIWRQEKVGSSRWAIRRTVCSCVFVAMSLMPAQIHEQERRQAPPATPVSSPATNLPAALPEPAPAPYIGGKDPTRAMALEPHPALMLYGRKLLRRVGAEASRGIQSVKPPAAMMKRGAVRSWHWLNGSFGDGRRAAPPGRVSR